MSSASASRATSSRRPGVFADLQALRACWHPVAFSADLADNPIHADLLGEPPLRHGHRGAQVRRMKGHPQLLDHPSQQLELGSRIDAYPIRLKPLPVGDKRRNAGGELGIAPRIGGQASQAAPDGLEIA